MLNNHIYRRIEGTSKHGFNVTLDNAPAVNVTVAPDYSGLSCAACRGGECEHIHTLRGAGYYPTQLVLDELWLHRLPKLPDGYAYQVTRTDIWHGVAGHDGVCIERYPDPRRYRGSARKGGLDKVALVRSDGSNVATLYAICQRTEPLPSGGGYQTVTDTLTPRASASVVKQLIAVLPSMGKGGEDNA